eukprot:m.82104 g.82104  ORF g.82104 m.82104 type:complete len:558 (+) comp8661_c1_seq10:241-1914(+)
MNSSTTPIVAPMARLRVDLLVERSGCDVLKKFEGEGKDVNTWVARQLRRNQSLFKQYKQHSVPLKRFTTASVVARELVESHYALLVHSISIILQLQNVSELATPQICQHIVMLQQKQHHTSSKKHYPCSLLQPVMDSTPMKWEDMIVVIDVLNLATYFAFHTGHHDVALVLSFMAKSIHSDSKLSNSSTAVSGNCSIDKEGRDACECGPEMLQVEMDLEESHNTATWLYNYACRFYLVKQEQQLTSDQCRSTKCKEILSTQSIRLVSVEDAHSLSVERFHHNYELMRKPVIIRGGAWSICPEGALSLDSIAELVGHRSISLMKENVDKGEWAGLFEANTMLLSEYINEMSSALKDSYLFDYSIPLKLPELLPILNASPYFENNYLNDLRVGMKYHNVWPSLFVCEGGLKSRLHVDSFGSNFWMALFQGKKRWVFYPSEDLPKLHPNLQYPGQYTFEFDPLDAPPSHPLSSSLLLNSRISHPTTPIECELLPGDLLFVPAGSPHAVETQEKSIAISGNYINESNFDLAMEQLRIDSLVDHSVLATVDELERIHQKKNA